MKHYTDEILEKYLDKRCGPIRSVIVSAHLGKCPECKLRIEALSEDRKLIAEIREAVGDQGKIDKMEAEFKGLERLRELLGDDGNGSKTSIRR